MSVESCCLNLRSNPLPGKAGQNLGHSEMSKILNFIGNAQAGLIQVG